MSTKKFFATVILGTIIVFACLCYIAYTLQPTNVAQLRVEIKKAPKYQIGFDSVIAGFITLRDLNDINQQAKQFLMGIEYRWRSDESTKLPDITLGHTYKVEIESGSVHETIQITFAEAPRMYHVETEYFDITFLVG